MAEGKSFAAQLFDFMSLPTKARALGEVLLLTAGVGDGVGLHGATSVGCGSDVLHPSEGTAPGTRLHISMKLSASRPRKQGAFPLGPMRISALRNSGISCFRIPSISCCIMLLLERRFKPAPIPPPPLPLLPDHEFLDTSLHRLRHLEVELESNGARP